MSLRMGHILSTTVAEVANIAVTSHSEVCLDDIVVLKSNKKVNPDGIKISKYQNGKTKSEEHYKDGKKEGKSSAWHDNGQIKSEDNYKDGKRI